MRTRIALLCALCVTAFSGFALAQESATKADHVQQNDAAAKKSITDPQFLEALGRADVAAVRKIMLRNGAYSTVVVGVGTVKTGGASGGVNYLDNKYCLKWGFISMGNPSPPPAREWVFVCTWWSDETR